MKSARYATYAIFLIAVLTVAVHVRLWLEGIEASPVATLYRTRTKTVYVEVPRDKKEEKGLKRVTVPCRPVQVLVAKDSYTPDTEHPPSQSQMDTLPTTTSHTSDTARMTGEALLGVFRVPPLPEGGSARVTLDEAGAAHLEVKAKPLSLFQLGRLRELGVWFDPGFREDPTWAFSFAQDIVIVGPAILRGRVEYGQLSPPISGIEINQTWKAELGVFVRF